MNRNRFIKAAEPNRPGCRNWFSALPEKTKKEILDAFKSWDGPAIVLAEAIKDELNLNVSAKEVAARIRDVKKQKNGK